MTIPRSASGGAKATTGTSGCSAGDLVLNVTALQGTWPNTAKGAFAATINLGQADEEKITVASYTSTQLTCPSDGRGADNGTAQSHGVGFTVIPTIDGTSYQDVQQHVVDLTRDDHTQYQKKSLLTTAGDIVYATGAAAWARLALGSRGGILAAGASAPGWLAKGTLSQFLRAGATDPAYSDLLVDQAKTATYSALAYEMVRATSGTFTVTSPAHRAGTIFGVTNQGTGVVTVSAVSGVFKGATIPVAGGSTFTLATGQAAVLYDDGTNYVVLTGNTGLPYARASVGSGQGGFGTGVVQFSGVTPTLGYGMTMATPANGQITVPIAGRYHCKGYTVFGVTHAAGAYVQGAIGRNGSATASGPVMPIDEVTDDYSTAFAEDTVACAAGDVITLLATVNGATLAVNNALFTVDYVGPI